MFSSLPLKPELLDNLDSLGYTTMTPIQRLSLPPILDGRDVIGQSKTGSGKTAAFGLGLLSVVVTELRSPQALVLCPTRELADQVAGEIRRLARAVNNVKVLALCGGASYRAQADSLQYGAHIVVGTPGRVEDHLRKRSLQLSSLKVLVLDEADRMLDMGFRETLDKILESLPGDRQTLLFSATFSDVIESIVSRVMRDPVRVEIDSSPSTDEIAQRIFNIQQEEDRLPALRQLLFEFQPESAVVFCNTKREVQEVAEDLQRSGIAALALHGDLEQRDRDQTLIRFSNRSRRVLVATDVAARGLDIDSLEAVINYQLAHEVDVHVHRIGRTGRAGKTGLAFSIVGLKDSRRLIALQDAFGSMPSPEVWRPNIRLAKKFPAAEMESLLIDGGKKQKLRAGDILGALTGSGKIAAAHVGKINILHSRSYVAVKRTIAEEAVAKLNAGKLKGRSFRVRLLRGTKPGKPRSKC